MQRYLMITLAALIVAPMAHAIPLSVLEEQARQRGKLEVALKALQNRSREAAAKCLAIHLHLVLTDWLDWKFFPSYPAHR